MRLWGKAEGVFNKSVSGQKLFCLDFLHFFFRAVISNLCVEGKASNYTAKSAFFINSTNCSAGTFSSESAPLQLCSLSSMYKENIFTNETQVYHT